MVNYQNGKIYKLVNTIDDKLYVGSTVNTLKHRKYEHKRRSRIDVNRPVYKHLNNIGWENIEIELLEVFPCLNKYELHTRERYWIETLKASLNTDTPTLTRAEYRVKNHEKIRQKDNAYKQRNKDKISVQGKEYREQNKELIKQRKKNYYERNKDKIAEKREKTTFCECGKHITICKLPRHKKSKQHQVWQSIYDFVYICEN